MKENIEEIRKNERYYVDLPKIQKWMKPQYNRG